jgi:hypothetical protein
MDRPARAIVPSILSIPAVRLSMMRSGVSDAA